MVNQLDGLLEDQKNERAEERQKEKNASFEEGFKNYASGFLVVDPEYDFAKFGEDTVTWIADFKGQHAADIKAKRIVLGLEQASVGEKDASILETSIPLDVIPIQIDDESQNPPPAQEDATLPMTKTRTSLLIRPRTCLEDVESNYF